MGGVIGAGVAGVGEKGVGFVAFMVDISVNRFFLNRQFLFIN